MSSSNRELFRVVSLVVAFLQQLVLCSFCSDRRCELTFMEALGARFLHKFAQNNKKKKKEEEESAMI